MTLPQNPLSTNFKPFTMLNNYFSQQGEQKQSTNLQGSVKYQASNVLQGRIGDKLGLDATSQSGDSGFDFEKVAENVLEFVSSAIAKEKERGASDEKLESMLKEAKHGIRSGFHDAVKELKGAGL